MRGPESDGIMDIAMRDMNGIEAAQQIKSLSYTSKVIMLIFYNTSELRTASARSGADGFMSKSQFVSQSLTMIKNLFDADLILGHEVLFRWEGHHERHGYHEHHG
jgi:DNA-binding NarL/FixJ family response regulator